MHQRLAFVVPIALLLCAAPPALAGSVTTYRVVTAFDTFTLFGAGVTIYEQQKHGAMVPLEDDFTHPHMPVSIPAAPLTMNSVYNLAGVSIVAFSEAQTTSKVEAEDWDPFSDMATYADFSVRFDFAAPAALDQSWNQPYVSTWSKGVSCGFCNTNPNIMGDDFVFDMVRRQYAFRTNVVGFMPVLPDWLSNEQPVFAPFSPVTPTPIEITLSHTDWLRMSYNVDDSLNWASTGVNYWRGHLETTYYYTLDDPAPPPGVPEPGSLLLAGTGLAMLVGLRPKRSK